jgi:hypothetical protein
MNLGILAEILNKPQEDLQKSYNIETEDLTLKNVEDVLKSELPQLRKSLLTEAKQEAYGRATREQREKVERQIADKFGIGVTGDLDTVLTELETKFKETSAGDDDAKFEKFKRDAEIWKEKFNSLNTDFSKYKETIEFEGKKSKLVGKLETVLPEYFDVKSNKLKELAISAFMQDYKFDLIDGDVQLFQGDKPLYKPVDEVAKDYFKDYFDPKNGGTQKPDTPKPGGNDPGATFRNKTDVEELFKDLNKARTSKERAEILARIKEVDKKS